MRSQLFPLFPSLASYFLQSHELTSLLPHSGLAWHTEEGTLRQKFEEFGAVEEAVCASLISLSFVCGSVCLKASPTLT
jgi:hypothetical protein